MTQLDTLGVMPELTPKLFKSNTNKNMKHVTSNAEKGVQEMHYRLAQRVVDIQNFCGQGNQEILLSLVFAHDKHSTYGKCYLVYYEV